MNIVQDYLPVGNVRPGTQLDEVDAIVLHWPADPGASGQQIRDYWASLVGISRSDEENAAMLPFQSYKARMLGLKGPDESSKLIENVGEGDFYAHRMLNAKAMPSSSAHCAISGDGTIVQCMPWNEVAYHVGSAQLDPASSRIYTDLARSMFGYYASNPTTSSPNHVTIGIEMCHTDWTGAYTDETVQAAMELCAYLCDTYNLDPMSKIIRHVDIVGWKQCPKWYIDHADDLTTFIQGVSNVA